MDFTDLIICVGTNPLPVAAVLKLFMLGKNSEGEYIAPDLKRVWLVYTEGDSNNRCSHTAENAGNIIKISEGWSRNEGKIAVETFPIRSESSPKSISDSLEKLRKKILSDKDAIIHFNYTPGTKSMVLFADKALEESPYYSRSYLDARTHNIITDITSDGLVPGVCDLRKSIRMSMQEILKIHGYRDIQDNEGFICELGSKSVDEMLQEMRKIFCESSGIDPCIYGLFNVINDKCEYNYITKKFGLSTEDILNKEIKVERKKIKIREFELPVKFRSFFEKFIKIDVFDSNFRIKEKNIDLQALYRVIRFFYSFWQEEYLFYFVKYIFLEKHSSEISLNKEDRSKIKFSLNSGQEIKRPLEGQKYSKPFEVDLIMVLGYLLSGISATVSSDEKKCKLKGFELLHRMRQIGGEESGCLLICGLKDVERLQDDLDSVRESGHRIIVAGWEVMKEPGKLMECLDRLLFINK